MGECKENIYLEEWITGDLEDWSNGRLE